MVSYGMDGNTMKKCFLSAHCVCPSCIVWMFGTSSVGCWFTVANILFQHNVNSFHKNDAMRVGILPHLKLDNFKHQIDCNIRRRGNHH
jgi:hypothetical protein